MPYNFTLDYYKKIPIKNRIMNQLSAFAGVPFKPWKGNYRRFSEKLCQERDTFEELSELPRQIRYYFLG